jgi:hypothetical protein
LTSEIENFKAQIEKFLARKKQTSLEASEISAEDGGAVLLPDGASLQVLPHSSTSGNPITIEISPPEVLETCNKHDVVEGGTPVSMYTCLPHGEKFSKPVLLEIPYDASIPAEQLAVFYMNADANGQPCGIWTMIDAEFTGNKAVLLTNHFTHYVVCQIPNMSFLNKAKLNRNAKVQDAVFPGLTYRGTCKNSGCPALTNLVNCSMGFGDFEPGKDAVTSSQKIICPLCSNPFIPEKFVLHDTVAIIAHDPIMGQGNQRVRKQEVIDDKQAVCLAMRRQAPVSKAMTNFTVSCQRRAGSTFGIDICFVMDCTGSMDEYIAGARQQSAQLTQRLQEEVRRLGMHCTVKIGFVGYRDYIWHEDSGTFEIPDDIICKAEFTPDLATITGFMASQCAYGGGDTCEHVVGGLKEAVKMNWTGSVRVVVLVADSPCHGAEFHDNLVDDFKAGDPLEKPEISLQKMLQKRIHFFFMRITSRTDIMIEKFRRYYDRSLQYNTNPNMFKIKVFQLGQDVNIMGTLIESGILNTISGTY